MGRKMRLPALFKNRVSMANHPWQWASCSHPTTHSFRTAADDIFKTVNSVFFDTAAADEAIETPESWFTSSSESASFSAASEESGEESLEMIIHGARSERLFFEPENTSSILETAAAKGGRPKESPLLEESVMLAVESQDPYGDFRQSMQEMVECHGLKDWESLEELLEWYLKMNGKNNHGFIIGAFVDLLVGRAAASSGTSSPSSPESTCFDSAVTSFSSVLSGMSSFKDQKKGDGGEETMVVL